MKHIELSPYLKRITGKFQGPAREKEITISVLLEDDKINWDFDPDGYRTGINEFN